MVTTSALVVAIILFMVISLLILLAVGFRLWQQHEIRQAEVVENVAAEIQRTPSDKHRRFSTTEYLAFSKSKLFRAPAQPPPPALQPVYEGMTMV